jgi:hypothetical protein
MTEQQNEPALTQEGRKLAWDHFEHVEKQVALATTK